MSVYTTVTPDELRAWLGRLQRRHAHRPAGHLRGHREHQLLRLHDRRPLRPDAVREAHRGRASVLSRPDGAPRRPRHPERAAAARPLGQPPGRAERQARRARVVPARARTSKRPSAAHCAAVGAMLARIHLAGQSYGNRMDNPRGLSWWQAGACPRSPASCRRTKRRCSAQEVDVPGAQRVSTACRAGAIHADLFRDNVLFEGARISGRDRFLFRVHRRAALRRRDLA